MSQSIRWILILPAAIAAWYVALFIGIGLYQGIEALCPASQVVSGHCFAPWFRPVSDGLIAFGAALAAVLVMLACTLLAPTHRRQVAIATFAVGTVVAVFMGVGASAYAAMVSAVVAGAVVLATLLRRVAPFSLPNKSLERTREK
jgi:hypothetical protein